MEIYSLDKLLKISYISVLEKEENMEYLAAGFFFVGLALLAWAWLGRWPKKEKAQEMVEVIENGKLVWRSIEEVEQKQRREKKIDLWV